MISIAFSSADRRPWSCQVPADPGAGGLRPERDVRSGSDVLGATLYTLSDHKQLPDTAKLA
jgi:hypothetical protein